MFGKGGEAGNAGGRHHGHSILQEGVVLRGEFEATGEVRLDGRMEGKIRVSERLTIGPGGSVEADVDAAEVIIMGEFKGKIRASRSIELRKGARVMADLATSSLIIEEGVHFHGHSNMSAEKAADEHSVPRSNHAVPRATELQTEPLEPVRR